jgi:hypothetical protein
MDTDPDPEPEPTFDNLLRTLNRRESWRRNALIKAVTMGTVLMASSAGALLLRHYGSPS